MLSVIIVNVMLNEWMVIVIIFCVIVFIIKWENIDKENFDELN